MTTSIAPISTTTPAATADLIAADARYQKAVHLAANAQQIVVVPGERSYLVPATEGGYYRVDADGCPCPDATYRGTLCKHQIAVAMLRIGAAAVEANAARHRTRGGSRSRSTAGD
jgi:hypothetical protein